MNFYFEEFISAIEGYDGWLAEIGTMLALVFLFNVVLKWALLKLHARFERKKNLWKDTFVVALITPLTSFVWLIAAVQLINFMFQHVTKQPLIPSPHAVFESGLILTITWFLLRWKKSVVQKLHLKKEVDSTKADKGKIDVLDKALTLVIYFIAAMLLLEQTGSSMNTLIAFGGVSGLAVAFASQQIIANFFGGIMIYCTKPFIIGDWIKLPEKDIEGDVEEIGWYTTLIRAFDKQPIYVPNSLLTNVLVINPSRMTFRQFKETLSLRYQDINIAPKIIEEVEEYLKKHPTITSQHAPQVHLGALGEYAIEINISAYSTATEKKAFYDVTQDILFKLTEIVFRNGADFAIPQTAVEFPKGIPKS